MTKPQRIGGFRWGFVTEQWFLVEPDNIFLYIPWLAWTAFVVILWLLDHILLTPTIGLIRLAIHHAHSPGWQIQAEHRDATTRVVTKIELRTLNKHSARRLRLALRRELKQGANLDAPTIHAAIAANHATIAAPHL